MQLDNKPSVLMAYEILGVAEVTYDDERVWSYVLGHELGHYYSSLEHTDMFGEHTLGNNYCIMQPLWSTQEHRATLLARSSFCDECKDSIRATCDYIPAGGWE